MGIASTRGYGTQDAGLLKQDSGFRIQDSGFRIQNLGFRIQDSGFRRAAWVLKLASCRNMKKIQ
jgi:hypothetical protein